MARVRIEFSTTPDDSPISGPPPGSTDWDKAYQSRRSEIAYLLGSFFVEHMLRLHREFNGDLELPILLGEIAHHNVSRRRSIDGGIVEPSPENGASSAPPEGLLPCNAFSISQATGIARETVRRKVDVLVKRGWLAKSPQGEITVTRAAGNHFTPDFNRQTLLGLLRVAEEVDYLIAKAALSDPGEPAPSGTTLVKEVVGPASVPLGRTIPSITVSTDSSARAVSSKSGRLPSKDQNAKP